MSLVAYGSSDESESEETSDVKNGELSLSDGVTDDFPFVKTKKDSPVAQQSVTDRAINNVDQENDSKGLFSCLPTPKSTYSIPDNTFKLLNKKQPVKIVLPFLNDIKTDKEEIKKPKPSTKGSGLFALLPAPKNATSLVPITIKNTPKPIKTTKSPRLPNRLLNPKNSPSPFKKGNQFEDDDDDENMDKPDSFFFSSAEVKPDEMEPVDIPEISLTSTDDRLPKTSSLSTQGVNQNLISVGFPGPEAYPENHENMETNDINDEALEKLVGASAKKRKGMADEEIIDINVDTMVGDAYMWLSKDLTKEQEHSSFKKAKNLSVVERRKHQITYLASQAKEKEMELRNQWANSRMTRKQTQSKYGF